MNNLLVLYNTEGFYAWLLMMGMWSTPFSKCKADLKTYAVHILHVKLLVTLKRTFMFWQFCVDVDVVIVLLIHLVRNSWHIFRCILKIMVVHSEKHAVFHVFVVAFISFDVHRVICSHANGFFFHVPIPLNAAATAICQI